jgi:hypothetical protein
MLLESEKKSAASFFCPRLKSVSASLKLIEAWIAVNGFPF